MASPTVNIGDVATLVSSARTTSETISHTPTVGCSMVVCCVDQPVTDGTLSATYNGVAMSVAINRNSNANKVYIFYLVSPPTGSTYSCVVTTSGGAYKFLISIVSISGTALTNVIGATNQGDFASNTPPSLSTTTTRANSILVDCFGGQNVALWSATSPQVQLSSLHEILTDGTDQGSSYLTTTTVGSYTTAWNTPIGTDGAKAYVVAEIFSPLVYPFSPFPSHYNS